MQQSRQPPRRRCRNNPRQPDLHGTADHRTPWLPGRRTRQPHADDDVPAAGAAWRVPRGERGCLCGKVASACEGVDQGSGGEGVCELHA